MKKIKTALILVFFCHFCAFAQQEYDKLTKEGLLTDFDFMVKVIKEQHPNPFRFITEKEFDQKATVLRKKIEKEPTIENFYLSEPLSLIRDAHASLVPDPTLFDQVLKNMSFFPFKTTVYDNRVFINQYTNEIPEGAELITINEIKVGDILNQIPNRVDGDIQASTQKEFSQYLSFRFPKAASFRLVYREEAKGSLQTVEVKSVDYERYNYNGRKAILPLNLLAYDTGIYGSQVDKDTYLLSIKSFNLSEEYAYYILNTIFTDIKAKNIKQVIIDIRDNAGGALSNIPLFYSFISKEKHFKNIYKYATKVPTINVRENLIDENSKLLNNTDIIAYDNFMQQRFDKNESDGFYYGNNRLDESYVENYPQDKNAFTGNVILLQNNNTLSAAAYFAYMFELNERGPIAGQETQSCSNFTTAAWFLNYKLPHTASIVVLPRSEIFFNTVANKDAACRGVLPHFTISADQFQKGLQTVEDPELNLALALSKK